MTTTNKISITRALAELKLLDSRIEKATNERIHFLLKLLLSTNH
jgi:hypothetical protein